MMAGACPQSSGVDTALPVARHSWPYSAGLAARGCLGLAAPEAPPDSIIALLSAA